MPPDCIADFVRGLQRQLHVPRKFEARQPGL